MGVGYGFDIYGTDHYGAGVPVIWVDFVGIIRDISISGPNITYKCEVSTSGITTSNSTLAPRNCAVAHATSAVSLVSAATTLTVQSAAVALAASSPTPESGAGRGARRSACRSSFSELSSSGVIIS